MAGERLTLPPFTFCPLRAGSPHPPEPALPDPAPCPPQPTLGHRQRAGVWEPRPCDQAQETGPQGGPASCPSMELRPWVLWVAAAAGALVLLAADARGQKVFTNTWAVHITGGPAVAESVARKHGFLNLGQVRVLGELGRAASPVHMFWGLGSVEARGAHGS